MSEEKFLAFKGLKQYDPGMGWASVHILQIHNKTPLRVKRRRLHFTQKTL